MWSWSRPTKPVVVCPEPIFRAVFTVPRYWHTWGLSHWWILFLFTLWFLMCSPLPSFTVSILSETALISVVWVCLQSHFLEHDRGRAVMFRIPVLPEVWACFQICFHSSDAFCYFVVIKKRSMNIIKVNSISMTKAYLQTTAGRWRMRAGSQGTAWPPVVRSARRQQIAHHTPRFYAGLSAQIILISCGLARTLNHLSV